MLERRPPEIQNNNLTRRDAHILFICICHQYTGDKDSSLDLHRYTHRGQRSHNPDA